MNKELFDKRAVLVTAYEKANDAAAEASKTCAATKQAVVEFDDSNPDIPLAIKTPANKAKWEAGAAIRRARAKAADAEAEAEGGDA